MEVFCVGTPVAYLEKKMFESQPSYKKFNDKELLQSLSFGQIRMFTDEKEAQAYAMSTRIAAKPPVTHDASIAPVFKASLADDYALPEQQHKKITYPVVQGMNERYTTQTVNYYLIPRDAIQHITSATFPNLNIPEYQFSNVEDAKLELNESQAKKRCCIIS